MSTVKVGTVTFSFDQQQHLHWVAELGRLLRQMHTKGQVFVERSSAHRVKLHRVIGTIPEIRQKARVHLTNLKAFMYCPDRALVSNEDLMNLIADAESYGADLDMMYASVRTKISIQPQVKHTHQFQQLVRKRITHRFLHRKQPEQLRKAA